MERFWNEANHSSEMASENSNGGLQEAKRFCLSQARCCRRHTQNTSRKVLTKIRRLALFPVLHKKLLEDVGVNLHSSSANDPVCQCEVLIYVCELSCMTFSMCLTLCDYRKRHN